MSYQIKLNVFEGPYDLLLFLIRKGEVDIYDIPIAKITKEYLEYIEILKFLDLDVAGEFIVVAATLMRIKARMLLPVYANEDEEIEDPRNELVQNLLEYQRIKEAANKLEESEFDQRKHFARGHFSEIEILDEEDEILDVQMSMFDLMLAYHNVLKEKGEESYHYVEPEPFTIEEQMDKILLKLKESKKISFTEHFMNLTERITIVINFLAILELARRREIKLGQTRQFQDIWIYRK